MVGLFYTCYECGKDFEQKYHPDQLDITCPNCGGKDVEVIKD